MQADDNAASSPATVYYNSACPVCDAGIRRQRDRMGDCGVRFIDVHTEPDVADDLGIDLEALRERLHVRDASGAMQVGERAFTALLSQTPGRQHWATVAARLGWITGPLYKVAARLLYCWNRRRGHW